MACNGDELHNLKHLRRQLHTIAEISGHEEKTALVLRSTLEELSPDSLATSLGGHGLAAVFTAENDGPTVLFRADMDALPIAEHLDIEHASIDAEASHKCGHDGHMAMAVGIARRFSAEPPARGRLIVLFQPAEETGMGAAAVINDPAFTSLNPDIALAVHNLPGFELGQIILRPGPFACASRGLVCELTGASSHAAEPQNGRSPALAVANIISAWSSARQLFTALSESAQATIIHASVGRPAFGTSPGDGRVMATLRAAENQVIDALEARLTTIAADIASAWGVSSAFRSEEAFPATDNDPGIVDTVCTTAATLGHNIRQLDHPFPWSEDFGHFGELCPAALIGLGAGFHHPALHNPNYDFPDSLIPLGVDLMEKVLRHWLGVRR